MFGDGERDLTGMGSIEANTTRKLPLGITTYYYSFSSSSSSPLGTLHSSIGGCSYSSSPPSYSFLPFQLHHRVDQIFSHFILKMKTSSSCPSQKRSSSSGSSLLFLLLRLALSLVLHSPSLPLKC
jgi:hypothetical protein